MAVDDQYTVSLLHFDNNLNDESGKVWTANGGATTSSAQSKFGGYSAYFDGTNDYLTTQSHTNFNFDYGDFTIDGWVKPSATSGLKIICDRYDASAYSWQVGLKDGAPNMYIRDSSGTASAINYTGSSAVSTTDFSHVAWVRYNGTLYFLVNGAACGSISANFPLSTPVAVTLGKQGNGGYYYGGYIDELRISKGIARWTSNFTPPTAPYGLFLPPKKSLIHPSLLSTSIGQK